MQKVRSNIALANTLIKDVGMEPKLTNTFFTIFTMMLARSVNKQAMQTRVFNLCLFSQRQPIRHFIEHNLQRIAICLKRELIFIARLAKQTNKKPKKALTKHKDQHISKVCINHHTAIVQSQMIALLITFIGYKYNQTYMHECKYLKIKKRFKPILK